MHITSTDVLRQLLPCTHLAVHIVSSQYACLLCAAMQIIVSLPPQMVDLNVTLKEYTNSLFTARHSYDGAVLGVLILSVSLSHVTPPSI